MCGVAFVQQPRATREQLVARIERMNETQHRRGPDARGHVQRQDAAIGHTRLRVLDLDSRADQPFGSDEAWLSYNGEIYNHRELRNELEAEDVRFLTTSDTEVLYWALRLWGLDALHKLEGMFALAMWFVERRELWLARDRMGIKPLHIATSGAGLAVASEAKAVAASGLIPPQLDDTAVLQILRFNHPLGRRSAIANVEVVDPGSAIVVDLDSHQRRVHRYFVARVGGCELGSAKERENAIDKSFRRAVRGHLVADVPVACYMSSGLDSCGIAFEAKRHLGDDLATYSMVFPGASYCEGAQITPIAAELGGPHHELAIDRANLDELIDFVWAAEMPQLWTSDLALKQLARKVSATGTKVVLSGEGPDELLAGYDAYRVMKLRRLAERFRLERLVRFDAVRERVLSKVMGWMSFDMSVASFYLDRHDRARRNDLTRAYGFYPENIATMDALTSRMSHLLAPAQRARLGDVIADEQHWFRTELGDRVRNASPLDANVLFETSVRLPRWVLHMGDRMSAAHGLEMRFPYLDDKLVSQLLSLPPRDRLRGLNEKHILKRIHRGRVPSPVVRKRKQPLYTPIRQWLTPILRDPRSDTLFDDAAFERCGVFDREAGLALAERVTHGAFDNQLDEMVSEWALMGMLTSHILARQLELRTEG